MNGDLAIRKTIMLTYYALRNRISFLKQIKVKPLLRH